MERTRYHGFVIFLHWLMALAIIGMLASGLIMENIDLPKSITFQMFQIHKSMGVLLLIAFFIRLSARLITTAPPLSDQFKPLDKILAKWGHIGLYVLMIAMPLTGWIMVSSSVYGLPTIVFGLFEWPHIPGIEGHEMINDAAGDGHEIMGWLLIALIAGHIGAVIKHKIIDQVNVLPKMGIGKDL